MGICKSSMVAPRVAFLALLVFAFCGWLIRLEAGAAERAERASHATVRMTKQLEVERSKRLVAEERAVRGTSRAGEAERAERAFHGATVRMMTKQLEVERSKRLAAEARAVRGTANLSVGGTANLSAACRDHFGAAADRGTGDSVGELTRQTLEKAVGNPLTFNVKEHLAGFTGLARPKPQPQTPNFKPPNPETPKPHTPTPNPQTLDPRPWTLDPGP